MSPDVSQAPASQEATGNVAGDSAKLAVGTVLSRVSGLARVLIVPAVFGATALGDMFLAVNSLPQVIFATVGGQALVSLLVPVLVRALHKDPARANLLGVRAMSIVAATMGALVLIGVIFHRSIASALTLGIDDSSGAAAIARTLLLLMLPQIVLYGAVAVFVALQHARGKFLLPSVAPIVENIAMVAAVVVIWRVFDDVHEATSTDTKVLVALGLGSTLAVLLHAIVQAVGAARAGAAVRLVPPRREPELTALRDQVRSSFAWTAIFGLRIIALTIAAGWAGSGAIQALQIGYILQNLPMALIGYPVAAALLPRLSRRSGGSSAIAHGYSAARNLVAWILVPIAVGMVLLSEPLGATLAVGRFSQGGGAKLVAAVVAGLAVAAVAEAAYEIARQATLAFGDIRGFTVSVWVRAAISAVGIVLAPAVFDGAGLLLVLGLVVSMSDVAALVVIDRPLRRLAESGKSFVAIAVRALLASVPAGAACLGAGWLLDGSAPIVRLIAMGSAFVVFYLGGAWMLSERGAAARSALREVTDAVDIND